MKQYFDKQLETTPAFTSDTVPKNRKDYFGTRYGVGDKVLFCMIWDESIGDIQIVSVLDTNINKLERFEYVDTPPSSNLPRFKK